MLRRSLSLLTVWTLGLTSLLATASSSQAEYFEFTTTVSISPTPGTYTPSGATITNTGGTSASFSTGNNSVSLTAADSNPSPPHLNGSLGTSITPLTLTAATGAINENVAFDFTINLTITNYTTLTTPTAGSSGTISLSGRLGGSLGNGAADLSLLSFANSPQTIQIDNELYSISLKSFGSPTLDTGGQLQLSVSSVVGGRAVPEPGSFALIGIGVVGAFGIYRRRKVAA